MRIYGAYTYIVIPRRKEKILLNYNKKREVEIGSIKGKKKKKKREMEPKLKIKLYLIMKLRAKLSQLTPQVKTKRTIVCLFSLLRLKVVFGP